jgi:hypothetical protein
LAYFIVLNERPVAADPGIHNLPRLGVRADRPGQDNSLSAASRSVVSADQPLGILARLAFRPRQVGHRVRTAVRSNTGKPLSGSGPSTLSSELAERLSRSPVGGELAGKPAIGVFEQPTKAP